MSKRIKVAHEDGLIYPNIWEDFDWVRENRAVLYEQYGASVLLIYQKKVVGFGKTLQDAEATAEATLPAESGEITPILYFLSEPYSILRLHRATKENP